MIFTYDYGDYILTITIDVCNSPYNPSEAGNLEIRTRLEFPGCPPEFCGATYKRPLPRCTCLDLFEAECRAVVIPPWSVDTVVVKEGFLPELRKEAQKEYRNRRIRKALPDVFAVALLAAVGIALLQRR